MNKIEILKNRKKVIIPVLVIALILGGKYAYNKFKSYDYVTLYGNVDIRQVSLAFNANDRIDEMYVEEGDVVKKGDVLAKLDTENLTLQIEKIKAEIEVQENVVLRLKNGSRPEEIAQELARLNAAKAEEKNAQLQYQRIKNTYKNSNGRSVSKQDKDDAEAKLKVATAQVKEATEAYQLAIIGPRKEDIAEAEAQLKTLNAELDIQNYLLTQTQLKAPIDGVIRSRLQEPGDMASPQRTTYLIAVEDKKWVRAYIQESQLGLIKPGMMVDVYIDSYPEKAIKGQIGYISSVAEFTPKTVQTEELRTSLMYEVRVYIDDNDNILRMGMPATIKINHLTVELTSSNNNTKE